MKRRPKPYDKTTHDGKTVDWLTKAALLKMERDLGYPLTIVQGSYHAGVDQSAGTHDGGGTVDLAEWDWENKVRVGRRHGFVMWHRPKSSSWNGHCHGVQMGNKKLSRSAANQVAEYLAGGDGLVGNAPDPHPWHVREFVWPYSGVAGLARWKRDQLRGSRRVAFLKELRRVVRGK